MKIRKITALILCVLLAAGAAGGAVGTFGMAENSFSLAGWG